MFKSKEDEVNYFAKYNEEGAGDYFSNPEEYLSAYYIDVIRPTDKTVLDIGCANGALLDHLGAKSDTLELLEGLEISDYAIDKKTDKFPDIKKIHKADVTQWVDSVLPALTLQSYDIITITLAMHLDVKHMADLLKNVGSLCKPHTRVMLTLHEFELGDIDIIDGVQEFTNQRTRDLSIRTLRPTIWWATLCQNLGFQVVRHDGSMLVLQFINEERDLPYNTSCETAADALAMPSNLIGHMCIDYGTHHTMLEELLEEDPSERNYGSPFTINYCHPHNFNVTVTLILADMEDDEDTFILQPVYHEFLYPDEEDISGGMDKIVYTSLISDLSTLFNLGYFGNDLTDTGVSIQLDSGEFPVDTSVFSLNPFPITFTPGVIQI